MKMTFVGDKADKWFDSIEEKKAHVISGASIRPHNDERHNSTDCRHELFCENKTKIEELEDDNTIKMEIFHPTDSDAVNEMKENDNVDLVSHATEKDSLETSVNEFNNKITEKVAIAVTDETGEQMQCTLWQPHHREMNDTTTDQNHFKIVAFRHLKVKLYPGMTESLSSCKDTRCVISPTKSNCPFDVSHKINTLKSWYKTKGMALLKSDLETKHKTIEQNSPNTGETTQQPPSEKQKDWM